MVHLASMSNNLVMHTKGLGVIALGVQPSSLIKNHTFGKLRMSLGRKAYLKKKKSAFYL